jgi:DNA modification methylase
MDGEKAALCFTSPPYNAGKTPTEEKMGVSSKYVDNSDDLGQEDYFSLLQKSTEAALLCCDYVAVNLQMLSGNKGAFIEWLHVNKSRIADVIIWDKQRAQPAMAENVLNSQFEFVWVLSQKGTRAIGTRQFRGTVSNVYNGPPQTQNEFAGFHSATFPVHLPEHFINALTNGGDLILETFCGSGTTLIACERLGRRCRACEIEASYVAVCLQRFYDMTGVEPVLLGNSEITVSNG